MLWCPPKIVCYNIYSIANFCFLFANYYYIMTELKFIRPFSLPLKRCKTSTKATPKSWTKRLPKCINKTTSILWQVVCPVWSKFLFSSDSIVPSWILPKWTNWMKPFSFCPTWRVPPTVPILPTEPTGSFRDGAYCVLRMFGLTKLHGMGNLTHVDASSLP